MEIIKDIASMRAYSRQVRREGLSVAFVPTMGALHRGHMELVKRARSLADRVVLSVFVNPAQFGPNEDYSKYPRQIEKDAEMSRSAGVDAFFQPSVEEVYPDGPDAVLTRVSVRGISENLCGRSRPGHFNGVALVVLKLLNIVEPQVAVFGLKDYQQFAVIRRMVEDLNLGVDMVGVETVRDEDGLALSSRNAYLGPAERKAALSIPFALEEARRAFARGVKESAKLVEIMKKTIEKEPLAVVDYISVCDSRSIEDVDTISDGALIAVAIKIGTTRLIDNVVVTVASR